MRAHSGDRSRELASGAPWPGAVTDQDCLALRATGLMVQGRNWSDSVRFAEAALTQAPCRDDPLCVWRALVTLTSAGELTAADTHCARLVDDVDPRLAGAAQRRAMMLRVRARIAVQRGDFLGARAELEELIAVEVVPRPMRLVSVGWLAEVLVGVGAVDRAEALLAQHEFDSAVQWRSPCRPMLLAARAAVHVAAGRAQAGLRDYLASGREFLAQGVANPAIVPWRNRAALAALAARREGLAVELAGQEWAAALRWGEPRVLGSALATVAIVGGGGGVVRLGEDMAGRGGGVAGLDGGAGRGAGSAGLRGGLAGLDGGPGRGAGSAGLRGGLAGPGGGILGTGSGSERGSGSRAGDRSAVMGAAAGRGRGMGAGGRGVGQSGLDDVELLREAADLLEVARARNELSVVQYELGIRLAARNDLPGARERLTQARGLAELVGDGRRVRAAELALRELAAPAVLTGQEERVARLARDGWANREIAARLGLAVRTVEVHLSRAYRKLGISGRDGLRSALF
ncbi:MULTISPECIES: helix-turn-helix transcriptional regulator [unclassified Crossiella]|uniref:helix-turn-helix domain-containing protein n=1 Tax=unclassified Crossiella TaxID=2620835 RepID=UPI0020004728|nr:MULTISPECIES: helix-turn-helix transcriptional regulator [unclassified Crossiella]MCK2243545.1 LuxR C-terminal-related transcriptional regulator [Crossiella sp. S99.2]MCK2257403.1 LuxR C-terminal-related transcriptional regulator [Crossiella sp. S99.1]